MMHVFEQTLKVDRNFLVGSSTVISIVLKDLLFDLDCFTKNKEKIKKDSDRE